MTKLTHTYTDNLSSKLGTAQPQLVGPICFRAVFIWWFCFYQACVLTINVVGIILVCQVKKMLIKLQLQVLCIQAWMDRKELDGQYSSNIQPQLLL